MLEIVAILLQVLFLVLLALLAPIGMWWLSDPSRDARGWIADAEFALRRDEPETAWKLARQAMSWPRGGRYSDRQAETTADALRVAGRALEMQGLALPEDAAALQARLTQGQRQVGSLADRAREAVGGVELSELVR